MFLLFLYVQNMEKAILTALLFDEINFICYNEATVNHKHLIGGSEHGQKKSASP